MTETRTDSGESRGSSTGPISVTGLDSAAVADAKDAVASTTPAGPTAPDEVAESERADNDPADEPKPRRHYWRELRTWAHGIADRLNKPPREIFADGRVYNRIRISTVVLMVAFLSVLWVYQVSRPAPTDPAAPAPAADHQDDKAGTGTTSEPTSAPTSAIPSTTPQGTPTPTPTPTGTEGPEESPQESPTEGEPRPSGESDRTAPTTSGAETTPASPAPTSAPPTSE